MSKKSLEGRNGLINAFNALYDLATEPQREQFRQDDRKLELPEAFDGQQIRNCTTVEDQEYMRGFNRCLEDIEEMNRG